MGGKGEGRGQRGGEGKANLSVKKVRDGTKSTHPLPTVFGKQAQFAHAQEEGRPGIEWAGTGGMTPGGSRVWWSFQYLSSFVPTSDSHAYYPDQLHTKFSFFSPYPQTLPPRWWELLHIYEASGPLVLLWR